MSRARIRAAPTAALASLARQASRVGRDRLAELAAATGTAIGRAVSLAVGRAVRGWTSRPGARARHLRRLGSRPLPNLYAIHPEARQATPREIGLRSVDIDEIAGTAVGGPTQRGADFRPLRAFRSQNWLARWQRIRRAVDRLEILPPIDVVRFPPGGRYWVLDGHNRVAAALDVGQVEIDANVTELVPLGQNPSERPADLAAALTGTRSLRAAGRGRKLQSVGDDVVPGLPPPAGRATPPVAETATEPRTTDTVADAAGDAEIAEPPEPPAPPPGP